MRMPTVPLVSESTDSRNLNSVNACPDHAARPANGSAVNWCAHCKAPVISMEPAVQCCITGRADCAAELERRRQAWLAYEAVR